MRSNRLLFRLAVQAVSLVVVTGLAVSGTSAAAQDVTPGEAIEAVEREADRLRPRTVAVVPFSNISGEPDDDWIGAGIAETVTADLERFGELLVLEPGRLLDLLDDGRSDASLASRGSQLKRDLAREVGVSWIVAGSFQRLGDQLRITARIVDVETGTARQTVTVDGRRDELFTLQDRIVAELTVGLASIAGVEAPAMAAAPRPVAGARAEPSEGGNATGTTDVPPPSEADEGRGEEGRTGEDSVSLSGAGRASTNGNGNVGAAAAAVSGGINIGGRAPQLGAAPVAGDAGALGGRVTVRPVQTQTPPNVDGQLDDVIWQGAARISEFVQRQPVDGAPATENTEVFLAYDSSQIYLAFHVKYQDLGVMRANRVDRDQTGRDDTIAVYFDPFLDQQRAYVFSVNGYGVQSDSIVGGGGGGGQFRGGGGGGGGGGIPRGDSSWDALFSTAGQPVEDGFTAEMAIPFKSLRYPARGADVPHTWGFQIVRQIRGKEETVVWSPVSRDVAGFLPQMGVLDGMMGLSTSRNLEILPTFTAFRFSTLDEDIGEVLDGDPEPNAGVNFKYGITSNLTADFTLNPDFSQVESDRPQIEVNQRFANFYPELRPFFLEGAEIFRIQGTPVTIVHSRTIVDPLYGAKVTGKAGRTTLGVLYANDEAASVGIDDPLNPAFDGSAQTFVGRLRYDLYAESFIGAIFTDREFLDGASRLAGIDSSFRIGDTHSFGFRALGTDHREETDLDDDDDGLETTGYLLDAGFRKGGRNLSYSADASALSPDFKTDVGFVRRTDQRRYNGRVEYQWWLQSWVISWGPEIRYGRTYNFDQVLKDENATVQLSANFANNIRYSFDIDQDMERYEGIDFHKRRYGMNGNINTSRVISFGGGFNWGDEVYFDDANPFLGRDFEFRTFINFRPVSRFASNINITTSRFTDPNGYFIPGINEGERGENGEVFDVKVFRALSTYQFTDRLLFRNIAEFDTHDQTLGLNFLLTYRVNSGTAFYIGYDDHFQQREQFDDQVNFPGTGYQRTNRAIFTKIQYLFRY